MRLLIATCSALPDGDEDGQELTAALVRAGVNAEWAAWDDSAVDWGTAPVLIRSTWDYTSRRDAFLAWAQGVPVLVNPAPVVHWSSDKTYLLDLAAAGLPVTPTQLVTSGSVALPGSGEFVVKPSVGAGSRGAGRFTPAQEPAAREHLAALLAAGRTVLVQPYLDGVDEAGETALLYFDGRFSHAIRKGPMLRPDARHAVDGASLWIEENITAREPSQAELAVGAAVTEYVAQRFGGPLTYARVDLLPGPDGPVVVELELIEPSLFLGYADGAADRAARAVAERIA